MKQRKIRKSVVSGEMKPKKRWSESPVQKKKYRSIQLEKCLDEERMSRRAGRSTTSLG